MTLVVINNSTHLNCIMAYADSRITGQSTLTEAAAKLFPLPLTVFGNNIETVFRRTFGFAFAGSSLVAHSVYSFASSALQTLRIDSGGKLPTLEEIARFVAVVAKEYIGEIGASQGGSASAEIAVFGYCPISEKKRLFAAKPEILTNEFNMMFGELDIQKPGIAHFLGDKAAADSYIKLNTSGGSDPGETMQRLINSDGHKSIGGSVQIMRVDEKGARNLPTLHKSEHGGAHLKLLGKKIEEFGPLGGCSFRHEAFGLFE